MLNASFSEGDSSESARNSPQEKRLKELSSDGFGDEDKGNDGNIVFHALNMSKTLTKRIEEISPKLDKLDAIEKKINKLDIIENADIIFLQETCSTKEMENIWKSQWKGPIIFAHGSNQSCSVLVLVKDSLEFELKSTVVDKMDVIFC